MITGSLLIKAKKMPVGTRRKRKTGWWIKDKPGHWKLLREHVKTQHEKDDVHHSHSHAKLMQQAAAKIVRHFGRNRRGYSRTVAEALLDSEYQHTDISKFAQWKKRTLDGVEKYLKEMGGIYGEGAKPTTKTAQQIQKWQDHLATASLDLHTQVERDQWVANYFASQRKPIAHVLYAAREFIGRDVHLSQVPREGFKGLCKAIIEKVYEHGPAGLDKEQIKVWEKAFSTVFSNKPDNLVPLAKALNKASQKQFRNDAKWFVYCCTRYAMKNEGMVDMSAIPSYIKNAKRYHGSKNPPSPTYDQEDESVLSAIRLGLLKPEQAKKLAKKPTITPKEKAKKIYLKKKRRGR